MEKEIKKIINEYLLNNNINLTLEKKAVQKALEYGFIKGRESAQANIFSNK